MAISNQKAVIGSEYLAYGGINQVWQCNSASTTISKSISNDPGDIGISNPCIVFKIILILDEDQCIVWLMQIQQFVYNEFLHLEML